MSPPHLAQKLARKPDSAQQSVIYNSKDHKSSSKVAKSFGQTSMSSSHSGSAGRSFSDPELHRLGDPQPVSIPGSSRGGLRSLSLSPSVEIRRRRSLTSDVDDADVRERYMGEGGRLRGGGSNFPSWTGPPARPDDRQALPSLSQMVPFAVESTARPGPSSSSGTYPRGVAPPPHPAQRALEPPPQTLTNSPLPPNHHNGRLPVTRPTSLIIDPSNSNLGSIADSTMDSISPRSAKILSVSGGTRTLPLQGPARPDGAPSGEHRRTGISALVSPSTPGATAPAAAADYERSQLVIDHDDGPDASSDLHDFDNAGTASDVHLRARRGRSPLHVAHHDRLADGQQTAQQPGSSRRKENGWLGRTRQDDPWSAGVQQTGTSGPATTAPSSQTFSASAASASAAPVLTQVFKEWLSDVARQAVSTRNDPALEKNLARALADRERDVSSPGQSPGYLHLSTGGEEGGLRLVPTPRPELVHGPGTTSLPSYAGLFARPSFTDDTRLVPLGRRVVADGTPAFHTQSSMISEGILRDSPDGVGPVERAYHKGFQDGMAYERALSQGESCLRLRPLARGTD